MLFGGAGPGVFTAEEGVLEAALGFHEVARPQFLLGTHCHLPRLEVGVTVVLLERARQLVFLLVAGLRLRRYILPQIL